VDLSRIPTAGTRTEHTLTATSVPKITWSSRMVTALQPNEVFVFGSNLRGFHGAGTAGLAMRGTAKNDWRDDKAFLAALASPPRSPSRLGKWAMLGIAEGFMQGREGMSYAIPTISSPGKKRSITPETIGQSVVRLFLYATDHPQLRFLITPLGENYAGWTKMEVWQRCWHPTLMSEGLPTNIEFIGRPAK
jgi:hypothetical protein